MDIFDVLSLIGGLCLFLFGMNLMGAYLEKSAGGGLKNLLGKLTTGKLAGFATGLGVTSVIQSSSATTVMVVGFVNSGLMTLSQAVWIIMGANVGTTITGQLVALDVGAMAPLFAFAGVAMIVFFNNPKLHHFGKIVAGLGILFIGMDMMGSAMTPLRESQVFIDLMTSFSNPLLGIVAGAIFTAVIQSSSASVGILQTLAISGLIPFSSAVYVLFGQNIGTCITAVLASIGTNNSAKRTTVIHLMFNIIGTTIFTILTVVTPVVALVESLTPGAPASQIANMHTIFNITTTLILLPFGNYMAKLATIILPEKETAEEKDFKRLHLSLGSGVVQMEFLHHEISNMVQMAGDNVKRSFQVVLDSDLEGLKEVDTVEEQIDGMNKDLSQYISKILVHNNSGQNVSNIKEYFLITGNAERIGDHAANIAGYVKTIDRKSIVFSDLARQELAGMQEIIAKAVETVLHKESDVTLWLSKIAAMEQEMDDMTNAYREKHLDRMHQGLCTEEACILYSELLTDFERIGDHILNIGQAFAKIVVEE